MSGNEDEEESLLGPWDFRGGQGCTSHTLSSYTPDSAEPSGREAAFTFLRPEHGPLMPLSSLPAALRRSSLQAGPSAGREDERPGGLPAAPVAAAARASVASLPKQRLQRLSAAGWGRASCG